MKNIEFPGYSLVLSPYKSEKPLADEINRRVDLIDTLHITSVCQGLFNLVENKAEILSVITHQITPRQMGIRWRDFP